MIYLELFYQFFKIGLFTFGGGYAMIPMIEQITMQKGWITMHEFVNMIAISESTPGPFAINMATFVGMNQAGFLGAVCSTIGVSLPSFIIILIIAKISAKVRGNKTVEGILFGIRPVIVALIGVACFNIFCKTILNMPSITSGTTVDKVDFVGIIIMSIVTIISVVKKKINPILLICVSGILGLLLYYIASLI